MRCAHEMNGFYMKCNTDLKWVNDMSTGLFVTQTTIDHGDFFAKIVID